MTPMGIMLGILHLKTAQRIMLCIRTNDIACRLGGDEFAIVLPNIQSY